MTFVKTSEMKNSKGNWERLVWEEEDYRWILQLFQTVECGIWLRGWGFASDLLLYNQCELEETINISEFQLPNL